VGKLAFVNKTIVIFLSLSAQIYDPLVSESPKECRLNLFPHGQFSDKVSHPFANVLWYFFYDDGVVNKLTTYSEKILILFGILPLFSINCI
jgi:hypothetical protein